MGLKKTDLAKKRERGRRRKELLQRARGGHLHVDNWVEHGRLFMPQKLMDTASQNQVFRKRR